MRKLFLIGYSPAEKQAWPSGGLGDSLEDLDPRHGVFPNHVMSPLLSTACFLPAEHRSAFLDDVRENILRSGLGLRRRRYNALDQNVNAIGSTLLDSIQQMFRPPATVLSSDSDKFNPMRHLALVYSNWSFAAILSFLIENQSRWTKGKLQNFRESFLDKLLRRARGRLEAQLPARRPVYPIGQLGVYFQIFMGPRTQAVHEILRECILEQRDESAALPLSADDVEWILAAIMSLVPLPHNEIYQNYHEMTNPIGLYQNCFVRGRDPRGLESDPSSPMLWEYVGQAIARACVD